MMSHITAIEGLAQQLEDLGSPMSQSQIMTKIVSTLPTAFIVSTFSETASAWLPLSPFNLYDIFLLSIINPYFLITRFEGEC